MNKSLIVQTRVGIGDFCMFIPFIKMIAKKNNSKVDILTKNRTSARLLLKNEEYVNHVEYVSDKSLSYNNFIKIIKLIKKKNYRSIYIFHFGFLFWFLKLIFPKKSFFYYGNLKKKVKIFFYAKQKVSTWLNLPYNFNHKNFLYLDKKWKNLMPKKKIVIGIGGSGFLKKWKIDNYIKIINYFKGKSYLFIIAGGKNEKKDFAFIRENCRNQKLYSLCEKKIDESIEVIKGSRIYLGNDTGFMHIAAFLNIKTIGLFGSDPNDYSSYNPNIIKVLPRNFNRNGYKKNLLMDGIYFEDVLKIFLKNLNL